MFGRNRKRTVGAINWPSAQYTPGRTEAYEMSGKYFQSCYDAMAFYYGTKMDAYRDPDGSGYTKFYIPPDVHDIINSECYQYGEYRRSSDLFGIARDDGHDNITIQYFSEVDDWDGAWESIIIPVA